MELVASEKFDQEQLDKVDSLLRKLPPESQSMVSVLCYSIGNYLAAAHRNEEAEEYWRRSLVVPTYDLPSATLAGKALADLHGTSRPDDEELDQDDLWPALAEQEAAERASSNNEESE